jgi:iron complex transport system substrate-binding protein
LARELTARGVRVARIDEAGDFEGVRANVRRVAAALNEQAKGEALIARMDGQLGRAQGAWGGRGALYLTSAGFTAGPGTLIDAALRAAGLANDAVSPGYAPVSLEHLAIDPPSALVLGFFDAFGLAQQQWGLGRHRLVQSLARQRAISTLPASLLGCPAWFAGDAVQALGAARRPS